MIEDLLTVKEVARILKLSESYIYELVQRGNQTGYVSKHRQRKRG